jgi:hypothetical protein
MLINSRQTNTTDVRRTLAGHSTVQKQTTFGERFHDATSGT